MTLKMTTSEAAFPPVNTERRAAAFDVLPRALHHYSAPAKQLFSHQPAVMLAFYLSTSDLD